MGTRTFIVCAVLVLVFGTVGRITYEQMQTSEPAYAQQNDDPRAGSDCEDYGSQAEAQAVLDADPTDPNVLDEDNDGEACETFDYDDDSDDTGASQDQYENDDGSDQRTPQRNRDLIDSGASGPGPVLTLPDGSCIPDYPIKRNGYCYR